MYQTSTNYAYKLCIITIYNHHFMVESDSFVQISEVCVKEFHASESSSWRQGKAGLASPLYQSKHVIKLLSSELRTDNGKKKMWLVLPYYQCGDLQQFYWGERVDSICKIIRTKFKIRLHRY